MFKKKVLSRFLGIYIGIVTLYTLMVTILVFNKSNKMNIMENNYSNLIYMEHISNSLDYKIDTALKYVDKLSNSSSILNHISSNDLNYVYTTNIYNDLITSIQTFDELGFSVGITKLSDDFVITPYGTFKYDYFLKEIKLDKTYLKSLDELFSSKKTKGDYLIIPSYMNLENSPYLTIVRKIDYDEFTPDVFFFITFDKSLFMPEKLPHDNGMFTLYTNDLIATTVDNIAEYDNFSFIKEFENTKDEINTFDKNNTRYYIVQSNELKEIRYIYSINKKYMNSDLIYILKSVFILNILLIILGILIIYNATRITYEPIRKLLNIFNTSYNKNNKSIDELEFLKSNIEDIYLTNKNLKENLNSSLSTLQESFFRKILYGLIEEATIYEEMKNLNLNTYKNAYTVCILDIDDIFKIENLISLKTAILTIFNDSSIKHNFFVIPLDEKNFCLIFPDDNLEIILRRITYILEIFKNDLSLEVIVSLSQPVHNISNISSAFQEALKLIEYKYSFTEERILTKDNIPNNLDETYFYPLDLENCIVKYINNSEYSKSIDLISKILDKNINEIGINPSSITRLKFAFINTIKRILNENDRTLRDFFNENEEILSIFNKSTINTFKVDTIHLFETLFKSCTSSNIDIENPTVSNILLYIQQNFDKDISLTDISNHFNLSEGYISKLLKNSININFKTYVNRLKVKKAKELLAKGSYKVNEVGKIVGCDNTNTFIRIFKKYEGISPGEYLKSSLNNKNS